MQAGGDTGKQGGTCKQGGGDTCKLWGGHMGGDTWGHRGCKG